MDNIGTKSDAAVTTDAPGTMTALTRGQVAKDVEIDFSAAPEQVALTDSTDRSGQLAVGRYVLQSDVDAFVRQGADAVDATVTTDFRIKKDTCYILVVSDAAMLGYIAGICDTGESGTLDIQATL